MDQPPPSTVYVGIDVAKDRLDVHVGPTGEAFAVARNHDGLGELVERLRALNPALIVLEATGGFEVTVAAALAAAGLPLAVVNPRPIRALARALGRLAKTDRLDAEVIALFAERVRPAPHPVPDERARLLDELVTRRRQLVEMIVAEGHRRRALTTARLAERVDRHLRALREELAEVERDLGGTIRGTPAWRDKEDLLTSVPGIGATTARVLLVELPERGRLPRRQLAALAGLAPINHDSGRLRGRRFIQGGRAAVRTALYMATLTAIRRNPTIGALYRRLIQAGKPAKLAIVACMRKLLTILNAILRDHTPWHPA